MYTQVLISLRNYRVDKAESSHNFILYLAIIFFAFLLYFCLYTITVFF